MKKVGLKILILCLYCFPFGYFSIYTDFTEHSMVGYLIMIIITSAIAFVGKYTNSIHSVIVGNILSLIASYYFLDKVVNDELRAYLVVIMPQTLLIVINVLNLIPQLFATKLADKYKVKTNKL